MSVVIFTEACDNDENQAVELNTKLPTLKLPNPKDITIDINEAHKKYGHVSEAALRATLKSINVRPTGTLRACEGCALAKAKAKSVSKVSSERSTLPGERPYVDISGPYKQTYVGSIFWILFVDNFSRKSWSFFTNTKSALSNVTDGSTCEMYQKRRHYNLKR